MLQAAPSRALLLRKKRLRIRRLLLIVRILTGRPASLSLSVFNFDALRVAQLRTQGHTTVGGGLESKTQSDVWTADFPFSFPFEPFLCTRNLLNFYYVCTLGGVLEMKTLRNHVGNVRGTSTF